MNRENGCGSQSPVPFRGETVLRNSLEYPFNNSAQTVWIGRQPDTDSVVCTEVVDTDGEAGEIRIRDKARNGFKMEFSGGAAWIKVRFLVMR